MKDKYMNLALKEAKKAYLENEVPVGAVIVKNDKIVSKKHNTKMKTNNILNHAEILAILDATKKIGDWRLNNCEMYVTLEPCPMCAGAIRESRIKKIYIGTYSNIDSNRKILENIFNDREFHHSVEYEYINDQSCSQILTDFFSNKR